MPEETPNPLITVCSFLGPDLLELLSSINVPGLGEIGEACGLGFVLLQFTRGEFLRRVWHDRFASNDSSSVDWVVFAAGPRPPDMRPAAPTSFVSRLRPEGLTRYSSFNEYHVRMLPPLLGEGCCSPPGTPLYTGLLFDTPESFLFMLPLSIQNSEARRVTKY